MRKENNRNLDRSEDFRGGAVMVMRRSRYDYGRCSQDGAEQKNYGGGEDEERKN